MKAVLRYASESWTFTQRTINKFSSTNVYAGLLMYTGQTKSATITYGQKSFVCPPVHLSVLCLTISGEQNGAASRKLAGRKTMTRVTSDLI